MKAQDYVNGELAVGRYPDPHAIEAPPERVTVLAAFDAWVATYPSRTDAQEAQHAKARAALATTGVLHRVDVTRVTLEDFQAWVNALSDRYSPATTKQYQSRVRSAIDHAGVTVAWSRLHLPRLRSGPVRSTPTAIRAEYGARQFGAVCPACLDINDWGAPECACGCALQPSPAPSGPGNGTPRGGTRVEAHPKGAGGRAWTPAPQPNQRSCDMPDVNDAVKAAKAAAIAHRQAARAELAARRARDKAFKRAVRAGAGVMDVARAAGCNHNLVGRAARS